VTPEQQKLAEDNHGLIFDFLNKRNLPVDDFYGAAAVGLCQAAISYNGKWKFSTFAFPCMNNEVNKIFQTYNTQSRNPQKPLIYLDANINDEIGISQKESIKDYGNAEETAISQIQARYILKLLDKRERKIVEMLMSGLNQREIAITLGISQQNVSLIKIRMRKKLMRNGVTI